MNRYRFPEDVEAAFAPLFGLHGKTIQGSTQLGNTLWLEFTDGTEWKIQWSPEGLLTSWVMEP